MRDDDGLGNRLAIYQNQLVDRITSSHDVDLVLPGQRPCAYFVVISAQDSAYRFLSSLFFSLAIPQLSDYARLHGEFPGAPLEPSPARFQRGEDEARNGRVMGRLPQVP